MEITVPDFNRHRAARQARLAEAPARLARQIQDPVVASLVSHQVVFKRRFLADGFGFLLRHDRPVVQPSGQIADPPGVAAENLPQNHAIGPDQLADSDDAELLQFPRRLRADAKNLADRHGRQQALGLPGGNTDEAMGFAQIRRQFGEKFVRRQSHGSTQVQFSGNPGLYLPRDVLGAAEPLHAGQVEKGFIDGQLLHQGRRLPEDVHDLFRHFRVTSHPHRQENRLRAKAPRREKRHGRMDAVLPCFVGTSGDNAAGGASPHHDREALVFRMILLFHRGIKGVHIDVQNPAFLFLSFHFPFLPAPYCNPFYQLGGSFSNACPT